jgi:hypothetical protein
MWHAVLQSCGMLRSNMVHCAGMPNSQARGSGWVNERVIRSRAFPPAPNCKVREYSPTNSQAQKHARSRTPTQTHTITHVRKFAGMRGKITHIHTTHARARASIQTRTDGQFCAHPHTQVFVCGLPGVYDALCGPRGEPLLPGSALRDLGCTDEMSTWSSSSDARSHRALQRRDCTGAL